MTEATELAELPPAETALDVYSKPGGLDPWLDKIRAEVTGHAPDLKTKKGRDAIASLAFKVRKVKIDIDKIADMLGLNRKHVRDRTSKRADFPRAFKIGRRKLYDREEVLEWIDGHQQAPDGRRTPPLRQTPSQPA